MLHRSTRRRVTHVPGCFSNHSSIHLAIQKPCAAVAAIRRDRRVMRPRTSEMQRISSRAGDRAGLFTFNYRDGTRSGVAVKSGEDRRETFRGCPGRVSGRTCRVGETHRRTAFIGGFHPRYETQTPLPGHTLSAFTKRESPHHVDPGTPDTGSRPMATGSRPGESDDPPATVLDSLVRKINGRASLLDNPGCAA